MNGAGIVFGSVGEDFLAIGIITIFALIIYMKKQNKDMKTIFEEIKTILVKE